MDDILEYIVQALIILSVLFMPSVGLSYKTLRFAANYQVSTLIVEDCEEQIRSVDETRDYFLYKLHIEGLDYLIRKRSQSKVFTWRPQPKFDWCQLKGKDVKVYHCDNLKMATIFKDNSGKVNLFRIVWNMESGRAIIGFILLPFLVLIATITGIGFLILQVNLLFKESNKDFITEKNRISYTIGLINHYIFNMTSLVLASYLVVMLGVVLIKGMLFIKGSSNFLNGLIFIFGLNIALFGPGLLVLGVHKIRSSKSQIFIFIRNVAIIGVLIKLALGITNLVKNHDFSEFNQTEILPFLTEVIKTIIF